MGCFLLSVLMLFLFQLQTGSCSVRCYSCSSKQSESCLKPKVEDLSLMKCDMEALEKTKRYAEDIDYSYSKIFEVDRIEAGKIDLACMKLITKVNHKTYVLRGCQLNVHSHLDICKKLYEKNSQALQVVHCSKCAYDHCNSSIKIKLNYTLILISAMAFIFFYTTW